MLFKFKLMLVGDINWLKTMEPAFFIKGMVGAEGLEPPTYSV